MMYGTKSADFRELLVGLGEDVNIDDDNEDNQVETAVLALKQAEDSADSSDEEEADEDLLDESEAHIPIFPILDNITAESLDQYRK
jgi:hypothetical protein